MNSIARARVSCLKLQHISRDLRIACTAKSDTGAGGLTKSVPGARGDRARRRNIMVSAIMRLHDCHPIIVASLVCANGGVSARALAWS